MANQIFESEFFAYLAASETDEESESDRLPSLNALSAELGVSVARLREQLEVAKALGLVEVRPRTGIRRLPYSLDRQSGKAFRMPLPSMQVCSNRLPRYAASWSWLFGTRQPKR